MKKICIFLLSAVMGTGIINAQGDCMDFFPETEGSTLITKTYDAADSLQNTMIYRVDNVNNGIVENSMEVGFTMMDNSDNVVSTANIETTCSDGNFNLKMVNRGYSPEVMRAMTTNTELIGYFLNYPDMNNAGSLSTSPFSMEGGEYTIEDNSDKKDRINVRVYNRQLEGRENVITPARNDSFDAYKISFDFDVTQNGNTTRLKGVEWYSPRYGIVRSETYDNDENIINRTELAEMHIM